MSSEKQQDVRTSNILAAKGILDLIRTSLGPRGLDKMLKTPRGDVLITNDGATIMKQLEARHPAARMLVELSQAQDIEAGDGTTSVVVLASQMLSNCLNLFKLGIHPTAVSKAFQTASNEAMRILDSLSTTIDLNDIALLEKISSTTLSSKVVAHHSDFLSPLVVRAVLQAKDATNVDLKRVRMVKKLGGTLEDCRLINGIAFNKRPEGLSFMKNPKVGLIQFCLSPPKTDMDANIVVSDDKEINRLLEQERKITLKMCKKVAKSGANLILIQKQTMKPALSEMALFYLQKLKIAVIQDVDRDEMEYVAAALDATIVATLDEFTEEKMTTIEEMKVDDGVTYLLTSEEKAKQTKTCCFVVRGANKLIVDEAERSIHDAMCSIRSLIKIPKLVPGGASIEVEIAQQLYKFAQTQLNADQYCIKAYADAFEIIPLTLAENAGLNPIQIVTSLRQLHSEGKKWGLNVTGRGEIMDMVAAGVVQPILVSKSMIQLATETARMLLKIDDIVIGR
ncbi:TCP-1_chaperonin subunit delta [Hexamita inflata]|uniref:T-complex protein 1 subunit delta n=1 Tax=Hexamita inflata TaxID=28002 RepID=A0AA86UPI1_9EUKA|nr:TCP-1 chaperonin subunit delta [Hexamita inflata]